MKHNSSIEEAIKNAFNAAREQVYPNNPMFGISKYNNANEYVLTLKLQSQLPKEETGNRKPTSEILDENEKLKSRMSVVKEYLKYVCVIEDMTDKEYNQFCEVRNKMHELKIL